jgi:hypothetical protein
VGSDIQSIDDSSPPTKKNKKPGVLSAIASKFSSKRKLDNRSPEAPPPPSKKPSFRSFTPSTSSYIRPSDATSGPPATRTSSLFSTSVNSLGSDVVRNYEVERLQLLLSASTEDLALERSRAAQRERLLEEEIASKSRAYEARIRELESSNKGEGSRRRK